MLELDPTERFSDRVASYVAARPDYPIAAVDFLETCGALFAGACVADIGCGTGISSRLFLQRGYKVIGVEPNAPMREAADALRARYPNFCLADGRAEATTLDDTCVDMIAAAQAFHWFRQDETRREFHRILKPCGHVALIWNDRRVDTSEFLRGFDVLIQHYGGDLGRIGHKRSHEAALTNFFAPGFQSTRVANEQVLDWEGLRHRVLSASYMPPENHPAHPEMIAALRALFERHNDSGQVRILYETRVHCGRIVPN
jgi:SAM-dependent methyltransferase